MKTTRVANADRLPFKGAPVKSELQGANAELQFGKRKVLVTLCTDGVDAGGVFLSDFEDGEIEKTVYVPLGEFWETPGKDRLKMKGQWRRDDTFALHGQPIVVLDK